VLSRGTPCALENRMAGAAERAAIVLALLTPVVIAIFVLSLVPGSPLGLPSTTPSDADAPLVTRRPASVVPQPPPTLPPYTAQPREAAAYQQPAKPTPDAARPRTHTVMPGDQLKHIAAQYGLSIWKIVDANSISDPDNLRVGQVLTIPTP
jgi:LysM repeat protein